MRDVRDLCFRSGFIDKFIFKTIFLEIHFVVFYDVNIVGIFGDSSKNIKKVCLIHFILEIRARHTMPCLEIMSI